MKLRVALARFFQCSPVDLRNMTQDELRAAVELADEQRQEASRGR